MVMPPKFQESLVMLRNSISRFEAMRGPRVNEIQQETTRALDRQTPTQAHKLATLVEDWDFSFVKLNFLSMGWMCQI